MGKKTAAPTKTVTSDPRFAGLHSDPRFVKPKRISHKAPVDDRFKDLLEQSDAAPVDKYGRKTSKSKGRKDLEPFYQLEKGKGKAEGPSALELARGQVLMESSDEEDTDESEVEQAEDDLNEDDVELGANRQTRAGSELSVNLDEDEERILTDSEEHEIDTKRLAAVNMDWDHIRAIDLFQVFSSVFATSKASGKFLRVSVYPSEFGKGRMAQEEVSGPPAEIFADPDDIDERTIVKADQGEEYNEKALRKYQLERLRYYYAVIEFSSVAACRLAFTEIHGTEFERSANFFDLRAIPDDMTFDDEPKDEAAQEAPEYEANDFSTDALRHSKVKLTWDQDDPRRSRLTRLDVSKLSKGDVDNLDFSTYLASGTESSEGEAEVEEDQPVKRDALRQMLGLGDGSKKKPKSKRAEGDMEITFMPALNDKVDAAVDPEDENALQTYKRKEKERRQRKKDVKAQADEAPGSDGETAPADPDKARAELELLMSDEEDLSVPGRHFDMNAIVKHEKLSRSTKRKRNKAKAKELAQQVGDDAFELNVKDERFAAVAQDPKYAIDPSNPRFKKTKNMDKLLDEARVQRDLERQPASSAPGVVGLSDLDRLVQSVKRRGAAVPERASKKARKG